jgi:uncharacterized membrane protein HdeD (DUF308 family)
MAETAHGTDVGAGGWRPAGMMFPDLFGVRDLAERTTRGWWVMLLTGIGWIVVSVIVFRFDYASVRAIAILFGILAISVGASELGLAVVSRGWSRFFRALFGLIFIAAGVVAFFTPGDTFVGLAAVISFYFVFAGTWDLITSLSMRQVSGWWIQLVTGLLELALGFWAAGNWAVSATVLVAFVGAMTLLRGVREISLAFSLRSVHEAVPQ